MFHHALDLFVQSSDYEGTSNAILEAMAMETPIVATEAGGTREQIEHEVHGCIVRCGDSAALLAAMQRAITDQSVSQEWARAARVRVEGPLSFAARMSALEGIYTEVAGAVA
jgi:glycosyltransferase involved in cell wall biosynthesis